MIPLNHSAVREAMVCGKVRNPVDILFNAMVADTFSKISSAPREQFGIRFQKSVIGKLMFNPAKNVIVMRITKELR